MSRRIFVSHTLPGEGFRHLGEHCEFEVWPGPGLIGPAALREAASGCRGLICLLTDRIDAGFIESMRQLEFVSSMSVGVDHVDVAALTARGIPLGHTPGVLVETTADTAFALMLAAARRVAEADAFVRAGRWSPQQAWAPEFFVGTDVGGATLGLVGLGEIGQAVARRAQGFGMRVLAWNRTPREVPGVEMVDLDELLGLSDFVSLHVALTADTHHLLNAARIARMKPGAIVVNTARGGVLDEAALAAALADGRLAAAGIDVYEREPVDADNPLLMAPNVVLAPHIGSATLKTRARMADMAVANALAALAGQRMPHCANPGVYRD
ncbi:2-hydroxyacid dehydrogenase [Haliea sp. E17]|uniref:2-hydroxyacid dehydrogenase n=1 Tax=Haliea sp. E17 TaxID=3401576 RepID=UPI003AAEA2D7